MSAIIIQIISLLSLLIIILIINKIVKSVQKEKRIADYALTIVNNDEQSLLTKINYAFWHFIHFSSKSLGKSKILDVLAHDYEKYILTKEENFKSGIDYLTVKIISTIIWIIAFIILLLVGLIPHNFIVLVLFIIIGYILPDFYWNFSYTLKCQNISTKVYQSIILISDNLNDCTIDEAIAKVIDDLDGPIKDEYQKVLTDITLGIDIKTAFARFYERTHIKEIKIICNVLAINSHDLKTSFAFIRNEFDYLRTKKDITDPINSIINVLSNVYLLIPIIFTIMIAIIYPDYFNIIKDYSLGYVIICSLLLLYLGLVIVIRLIGEARE
jgi:tight adherence protein C